MKKRLADEFKFRVGEIVVYRGKIKQVADRRFYKIQDGKYPEYRLKRFRNWIPEFGLDSAIFGGCKVTRKATPLEMLGTLTVIKDRYSGAYSGAQYLAFKLQPNEIPEEIWGSDVWCSGFWSTISDHGELLVGKGKDPMEAINDLLSKQK